MANNLETLIRAAACVLVIGASTGCGDDAETANDAGLDGGERPPDGGGAGSAGATRAGSGGAGARAGSGADASAGSGADEDGGAGMPGLDAGGAGTGADGGAAGDAGSAGAGGQGGTGAEPTPGCVELMACCTQLPNPDRMSCNLVAENSDDEMCEQLQPLFCTPSGAGADSCPMLNDCCEMLPRGPLRLACATTVMGGMPLECEQGKLAYCPGDGDPNACSALGECCDTLRPPQRPGCNSIAEQGIAANCEIVDAVLCP